MIGDHARGVFVALAGEANGESDVAEIHAGRSDRIHHGGDAGLVHQFELRRQTPLGPGIFAAAVNSDGRERALVVLRNGMLVSVDQWTVEHGRGVQIMRRVGQTRQWNRGIVPAPESAMLSLRYWRGMPVASITLAHLATSLL